MSLAFLITAFIVVASPGTGAVYTLATGLSRGWRAAVVAAFACTMGIVPHLAAALMGIATLLHTSALAFETLKYAGVAYLLYMAWQTLKEHGPLRVEARGDAPGFLKVLVEGVVINLLNPKLSIFFVAFLPQFIAASEAHPIQRMLVLSAVFMVMTFVVFALYGVFAGLMREKVLARPAVLRWMRASFAAAFAGLAVKLALAER